LIPIDEVPGKLASVKVQHLGGDPINFASTTVTVSVNDSASDTIQASVVNTDLGVLSVGDVKTLHLKGTTTGGPATKITAGSRVDIKFVDIATNQLICDKTVRF
jgi:FlaG/FlaF family flagellin (archaellin)